MTAKALLPTAATFGALLYYLRRQARLSQRELAIKGSALITCLGGVAEVYRQPGNVEAAVGLYANVAAMETEVYE